LGFVSVVFIQSQTSTLLFTRKEPDGSMLRIIFYIDDGMYFGTSEGALDRFKHELPATFNADFMGTANWYISTRVHQQNNRNITIDQLRYAKSIVICYLDSAGG
jgi:hypothetical protein